MSPERALAAALYSTLRADAGVKALLGDPARVYDAAPDDVVFPYATLGRIETRNADAAAATALEHIVTLHAWSRYGGRAEVLDVVDAMRVAAQGASLIMTGRRVVLLHALFSDVFRSGDARTTHGVLRLRAISELSEEE